MTPLLALVDRSDLARATGKYYAALDDDARPVRMRPEVASALELG